MAARRAWVPAVAAAAVMMAGACQEREAVERPCSNRNVCATGEACRWGYCLKQAEGVACETSTVCAVGQACTRVAPGDARCLAEQSVEPPIPSTEGGDRDVPDDPFTAAVECDDGNVCTADVWTGAGCAHVPDDGIACDDGNRKTGQDRCRGGVCRGDALDPLTCCGDACADCTRRTLTNGFYACTTGECTADCNTGYRFVAGVCVQNDCPPSDACTIVLPNPTTGACDSFPVDDGTPCDNPSDLCRGPGRCAAGVCAFAAPVVCNDNDACTVDTCDPSTGSCRFAPLSPCPSSR